MVSGEGGGVSAGAGVICYTIHLTMFVVFDAKTASSTTTTEHVQPLKTTHMLPIYQILQEHRKV